MIRLVYVILISAPIVIFYLIKSNYVTNNMEHYSDENRYEMVRHMISVMKFNGRISTKVYGVENLPKEGGYVMYPNHQGKYDVLGIIGAHENPCSFVIDQNRSGIPFAREITKLLKANEMDKADKKSQVRTIRDVANKVMSGKRYIIFPEGGYTDNNNDVHEFMAGTFQCSVKSKTPIIPVALIDSYKVFGINSLKKITTQVHFLEPIYYEDYKEMTTQKIADLVQHKIEKVIETYA